ncbi:MAG TPA: DNA repair protein RecN [Gammaproteobacteria bacterium]|nr:DNA repair protein RecN [Gammaproteobacteria bacterium]
MLSYIHIRDFAIVDELEFALAAGLTALTGETGAGKSILVDALGFVLGDRADTAVIRHGAAQAEVVAEFSLDDAPATAAWLAEQDLAAEDQCLLRRVLGAEGRSRGYVNGRPVPMQTLKALGEQLVDIHGQHEHQSLTRAPVQMQLLDGFGRCEALRGKVGGLYRDWKTAAERLAALASADDDRTARIDLLRYQVRELEALALAPGEVEALDGEHRQLAHAERLIAGCQNALAALYENDDGSAYQLLTAAERELRELAALDARLTPIADTAATAAVHAEEAADSLRHHLAALEVDPGRLQWVENRIGGIHELARKHRIEPAALLERLAVLQAELADLEGSGETLDALRARVETLEGEFRAAARELHEARAAAAKKLGTEITAAMQELGMPGGRFDVTASWQEGARFSPHGLDEIAFLVSANPGSPPRPLAKVASGGELSRIALAIQVIAARAGALPTLVFDEVDAGIGGRVAEIVGRKLRALGGARQVLCVTHLPQVASQAHQHFQVGKRTQKNTTRTTINELNHDARIEELARMLGGVKITETTRKHAREMLAAV